MTYNLNYAITLNKDDNNCIVYDSKSFDDNPIPITTIRIINLIENFIHSSVFEKVGIVEENSMNKNTDFKQNKYTYLKSLSGEAYIADVGKLQNEDSKSLNNFKESLVDVIKNIGQNISSDNFLDIKQIDNFSTLREIIEIRNYMMKITNKKKGYLFIINI
ncbi:hypothetical protein ACN4EE_07845 [Geminocystis sp. CENA526]|uniref:hypothetical protein n=1 Tax=Geminocystis sp. CENA526 TaxID=1355871 RepID=UPI003D6F7D7F